MSRSPLPFGYPNYQRQNELSPGFNNDTQPTTVAQFDPKRGPNPQQPFYMDRNNHRGKIWDSQNIASQTTHLTENPPAYEPRRTTASRAQSPPEGEIKPEESSRDPGSLISLQNKVDLIKTERPSKDEEDTTAAVKYHDIFVRSPPPALTGDNGDEVEESFGLDTLWTAVQEEEKQKARRSPPRTKRLKNRDMTDTRGIFNQDNKHEQTDKPKKDNPLACTRCSEQFSSRNALFKHLKASGHDKDDGHEAGDSYSVESTEGHSFKQQKSSVTSTTCSRCNKEFSSRNALFKHLKASQHDKGDDKDTYNQRKATSLTCSRCNKQFNSRNALFKHIRAVGHDGDSDDRDSDDEIVESDEDMGFNLFE
ncbi:Zinc finger, C2H2 [Penicillium occitanis (nom. inval.)]|nr:Zinc finger, C2H2 [Penicillium occitanis (nom. inval.)]PCH05951.1 hypothetical protein PENOC_025920 [Penicillium occitanis (nom. inval.)]